MKKVIYVFGSTILKEDSLPIEMVPELKKRCPDFDFQIKDPNEEWDIPEELIVIDTVMGISKIHIFESIDEFTQFPKVSIHDYDALSNLLFLKKLGRLKKIKIIGIPSMIDKQKALEGVLTQLSLE
ncbi:MAG: hypothetical protein KAS07_02910 [Candidatus Pacebacteria bacterium]|nr:hypothetical protein [Candidatus Paceibacterota bacterium]